MGLFLLVSSFARRQTEKVVDMDECFNIDQGWSGRLGWFLP